MNFFDYVSDCTNAPRYLALALTPHERRMAWGSGLFKFREGACPATGYGGRNRQRKPGPRYGLITRIARAYCAGKLPGKRIPELARENGVKEDSLRATISTEQCRRRKAEGKAA